MLNKVEREWIKRGKSNPNIINYLYGEIIDHQKVIDELGIDKNSVVLDIGVGKGTFLTNLIITAGCKGIGIEPVEDRYVEFLQLIKKHKLENKIESHKKHYPCPITLKPTHIILHACAFRKRLCAKIYDALPHGVKILHNSLSLKRYAHDDKNNRIKIKTSYLRKEGTHFWIHEK